MVVALDPASARHKRAMYIERERVVRGLEPPCGVLYEAPSQSTCTSCQKGDDARVDEDSIALASPTLRRTAATLRLTMLASTCDVVTMSANVALAHRENTLSVRRDWPQLLANLGRGIGSVHAWRRQNSRPSEGPASAASVVHSTLHLPPSCCKVVRCVFIGVKPPLSGLNRIEGMYI